MILNYVGWVPTALGRLSFTQFGDHFQRKSVICKAVEEGRLRAVFGIRHRRTVKGGGGFPTLHESPAFDFAYFLRPTNAKLPVSNGRPEAGPLVDLSLVDSEDGALEGQVFFVQRAGLRRGRLALSGLTYLKDHVVLGNAEKTDPVAIDNRYESALARVKAIWRLQRLKTKTDAWDHEFGVANVLLLRTGECRVSVDPAEQSLWIRLGGLDVFKRVSPSTRADLENLISKAAAEAVFLAVRDVAHRHYHHTEDRAVDGPVTRLTPSDDATWRRRTLEGLMRMCIGLRRKGTATSLRHALGVLAYVDAFDRHLEKWQMKNGQPKPVKAPTYYDLSALKSSIDAALKVRELDDQALRNRLLFVFGLIVTTVTVVAPAYRQQIMSQPSQLSDSVPGLSAKTFSALIRFMIDQPIAAIVMACFLGWWIDKAVAFFSHQRPFRTWEETQTRIISWMFARARLVTPGSREARALVIALLTLSTLGGVAVWWSIFKNLSEIGIPIIESVYNWFFIFRDRLD